MLILTFTILADALCLSGFREKSAGASSFYLQPYIRSRVHVRASCLLMTSPQTKQQTALRVKLENLSTRTTLMFCWHLGPAVSHLWAPSGKNRFRYYYNQKGNNTSADKEILGFRSKEGCMSWGILMDAKKTLYLDSNLWPRVYLIYADMSCSSLFPRHSLGCPHQLFLSSS